MTTDQTNAPLSTMPDYTHAPCVNFPLPRELRDLIYSYLLDGVHTREVRLKGSKHRDDCAGKAYQFHTNILAVNKAIHTEGT